MQQYTIQKFSFYPIPSDQVAAVEISYATYKPNCCFYQALYLAKNMLKRVRIFLFSNVMSSTELDGSTF